MIIIVHGEDISSSRNYYQELKNKHKNLKLFDSKNLTITSLTQNISGAGLFSETNSVFIENFLTKIKKTTKEAKEILTFIAKNSKEADFVFWEPKEISKKELFFLKDAVFKNFKLPQNIFSFLDNLKPNNDKNLLTSFHTALDNGIKEELILFMLQRQIRILLAVSSFFPEQNGIGTIDEISRLAPWQVNKLEKQAQFFSLEQLKQIYKRLYEIEIGQKTGDLNLSLTQSIDFLLLEM